MTARPLVRAAVALAAALAVPALLAVPATAAVTPPACADAVVSATWTTGYAEGRYELSTVTLDGLAACSGSALEVGVVSAERVEALDTVVRSDDLVLDVAALRLPAAEVDRIAVTLVVSPSTEVPGEVGSAVQVAADASPAPDAAAGPGSTPVADGGALPTTGVTTAWLAPVAAVLVLLGALARRRARRAAADV